MDAFFLKGRKRAPFHEIAEKWHPVLTRVVRVEDGRDNNGLADKIAEFVKKIHAELLEHKREIPEIICVDGKALCGTVQENGEAVSPLLNS